MSDKIINYIKDNFSRKRALFVGFLGFLIFFASIDGFIEKFAADSMCRLVFYLVVCAGWFMFWFYSRKYLPRNKKGHIGIVIAIETENDKQKNRIKNDFVKRLRELIAQRNLKSSINVILLSNYQAEYAIDVLGNYVRNKEADKEWQKIRKRTQGHFFIYGGIKERQDGENSYYLDLEALVTHAPVRFPTQEKIVQEFLSVWYKQISFQEKIEFKGFLFAADSIFIAVQYVVGIAALVSGDISLALELHTSLDNDPYFTKFKQLPPNLVNVKKKLKALLAEENFLVAKSLSKKGEFSESEKHMERSLSLEPNYGSYLLKSIIEFTHKNNPDEALKAVYKAKNLANDDGTWRYNEAFLLMYMERFDEAIKIYEKIIDVLYPLEGNTLNEVFSFNEQFVKIHPEKPQAYFILGLLKYKKEMNYPVALECFEKFLLACKSQSKYQVLIKKAEEFQVDLRKLMNL